MQFRVFCVSIFISTLNLEESDKEMYEYKGVIHVHTKFSDGSATVKKIISKAQNTELDYVIITDHDTLDAMKYGYEGWHGDVLLLIGEEISPIRNHYLALGIKREIKGKYWRGDIQSIIDKVKEEGGVGIIAHPYGKNPVKSQEHSWVNWKYEGFDGLEVWSYMLDWVSSVNYLSLIYYFFNPEKAIRGPNPLTLRKWDEIAIKRHIVGIGSVDAHGKKAPILGFIKFFPYEYLFKTIRTHILVPVPLINSLSTQQSKKLVYDAIKTGHCFIGYDFIGNSSGFRFTAVVDGQNSALMGDELEMNKSASLYIKTPLPSEIRLIRNGELTKVKEGNSLDYETNQTGVYRVEVYLDNQPWIFSNPIFLRNAST